MKIEIKYSQSEGPHFMEFQVDQIVNGSHGLTITQQTPKGNKVLTITGTQDELQEFARLISGE